jgi:hypothetical protein
MSGFIALSDGFTATLSDNAALIRPTLLDNFIMA